MGQRLERLDYERPETVRQGHANPTPTIVGNNETPIAWWELLFTPVVLAYLCLTLLLRIPYLVVYPERQAFDLDFEASRSES